MKWPPAAANIFFFTEKNAARLPSSTPCATRKRKKGLFLFVKVLEQRLIHYFVFDMFYFVFTFPWLPD